MDKRSLWIGIGSGMIVGAVLLQLANVGQNALADNGLEPEQVSSLSREQLENAAKSMNLKLVDNDAELYTETEWVEKKKQESSTLQGETATAPKGTEPAEKPETPVDPQQPSADAADSPTQTSKPETSEPTAPAEPKKQVSFRIRSGSTLVMVAENLEKAGIVDDAKSFIKAGREAKINTKIQVGTYSLEKGESYQSIIDKIIKEPSS